jgi:hypothetical protein
LAESHTEKLTPTGEGLYLRVAVITSDTAVKLRWMDEVGELSEHKLSGGHPGSLAENLPGENRPKSSNRSHPLKPIASRCTLSENWRPMFDTRTVVMFFQVVTPRRNGQPVPGLPAYIQWNGAAIRTFFPRNGQLLIEQKAIQHRSRQCDLEKSAGCSLSLLF